MVEELFQPSIPKKVCPVLTPGVDWCGHHADRLAIGRAKRPPADQLKGEHLQPVDGLGLGCYALLLHAAFFPYVPGGRR